MHAVIPPDKIPVFLTDTAISALDIHPRRVSNSLVRVLLELDARSGVKSQVSGPDGTYFQALTAISPGLGLSCVKWVSIVPPREGGVAISATLMLTDVESGKTRAILDGTWITRARTAAMSALAARALSSPLAETIGFVGAGAQARNHLEALKEVRPHIKHITIYDKLEASADNFAQWAAARGVRAATTKSPENAVRGQDIIVSTVPTVGLEQPFLDASWMDHDSFVSMVDLGRSWIPESFAALDIVATDEIEQSAQLINQKKISYSGSFAFSLRQLVENHMEKVSGRNAFLFSGVGIADLAVGALVLEMMEEQAKDPKFLDAGRGVLE